MTDSLPFAERLLASRINRDRAEPFITVAIPHYKHRRYLEVVLASLFEQTYDDYEIVISDDCSPDDSNLIVPDILSRSNREFRYYAQPKNLGYDGNVRFCLASSRGQYVLLLGNDDAIVSPTTLEEVSSRLLELGSPEVAFTNFQDWTSGEVVKRAQETRLLGSGPPTAIQFFRSFSFVSGLIFDRAAALRHESDRWDRSIFYQIYLACRILASGGRLGALNVSAIAKDVAINGVGVPNYASKWKDAPWSFQFRHTGLDSVMRVTVDAVTPLVPKEERSDVIRRIVATGLTISYPFWLFEYRRVANWSFAVGVARGLWPGNLLKEYDLKTKDRLFLWGVYSASTLAGLTLPSGLFERGKASLANSLRRHQQSRAWQRQHLDGSCSETKE